MQTGNLTAITGPMFSGKTEELLRKLKRAEIAGKPSVVFKPTTDTRSGRSKIRSKDGRSLEAFDVDPENPHKILEILRREEELRVERFHIVAIDEAQFFGKNSPLADVVADLAFDGYRVYVAGLDLDFRGEPFGVMPEILALAENVLKLPAVCSCCGSFQANYSQRLINNKLAPYEAPTIRIEGLASYEARCRDCFIRPEKQEAP